VTGFLSDIVDDIKNFLDDEVIDRGRDTERDLRGAGRNWTDDDDRRGRSRTGSHRGRDNEVEDLRRAVRSLASKIDALAESGTESQSDLPINGYDDLTAVEINHRLGSVSQSDLHTIETYERANANRTTVLGRIESLQGTPPWEGYDEQTVVEIRKALTGSDEATAGAVKTYEAGHKNRQGVLNAANTAQNA
jgi:hypothetical protein